MKNTILPAVKQAVLNLVAQSIDSPTGVDVHVNTAPHVNKIRINIVIDNNYGDDYSVDDNIYPVNPDEHGSVLLTDDSALAQLQFAFNEVNHIIDDYLAKKEVA